MSLMRSVTVAPGERLAKVQPACVLRDVDAATQEHGLATVLGFVSETGVAGLTLGGGWGCLTRRFSYRLHPVGPRIIAGPTAWSGDRAAEIFRAYREITSAAPRELTLAAVIRHAPPAPFVPPAWHGKRIEAVVPATRAPTPTAISPPCGDFRTRSSAPSQRCRTRRSSRC